MVPLSLSNLVVFALLALLVTIPATIILALLGIKRSIRHGRFWRYGLPCCVLFVALQLLLLFNHRDIEQAYSEAVVQHYTHHLSSPKVYDDLHFPAGSTVVQSTWEPHDVSGGTLPVETMLLGLPIRGDFSIAVTGGDNPTRYVSEGVLTRPTAIHGLPCAAAKFKQGFDTSSEKETVDCTLAADHVVGELALPAGTDATFEFSTYRIGDVDIIGDAPHDWLALGVRCAKGVFSYHGDLSCTPAVAQRVAGYPLGVGRDLSVYREHDGDVSVGDGMLAEDVEVAGVHIPAGSTIDAIYNGHGISAARLRAHDMDDNEYVRFELPKGARLDVAGTVLEGDSVTLSVYATSISAFITKDSGTDHTSMRNGEFDMASRTWQWKAVDD
ncbi:MULTISPECIES: hypothetical protein [Dyella]|uniref:hypothetical protein n=1 Tax=Dyella TaxID=231454 RepID=UPI000C82C2C8|nr:MULTISPECIES: hypothetical protein [Dyella]MDR3447751.1 hypothetical protein [Dyella sp.]PMQ05413.1 hypothetical protein DyAD56_08790 [Dyella sp. AD56]ULU24639.1 hypothetical protein DYST_01559 [Dyella terrae]